MCRGKNTQPKDTADTDVQEGAIFETLRSAKMNSTASCNQLSRIPHFEHYVYDELSSKWINRRSRPQPLINITVRVHPEDFDSLGMNCNSPSNRSAVIPAMADTGCQSCLAGLKVLHRLGLQQDASSKSQ